MPDVTYPDWTTDHKAGYRNGQLFAVDHQGDIAAMGRVYCRAITNTFAAALDGDGTNADYWTGFGLGIADYSGIERPDRKSVV